MPAMDGTNTDLQPQGPSQGTSYIYKQGTTPNTRTVVSQKCRVLAPAYGGGNQLWQIGVVGNFNPSQSRQIDPVLSIGYGDIIAELVPGNTSAMELSFERTMLYLANLWQATGYASGISGPARSIRHHRWPFDILQQIVFSVIADMEMPGMGSGSATGFGSFGSLNYGGASPGGIPNQNGSGSHNILITMYEACWWNQWGATFQKDQAIVSETGTATCTDVHDFSSSYGEFLQTGLDPTIGQYGSIRFGKGQAVGGEATLNVNPANVPA